MAKVFLSHRGCDGAEVARLAEELQARGHDIWVDTWRIKIGDSVVGSIDDGLFSSDFLILCCSAQASASFWMNREWMSALARQLEGAGIKILPVLLTGGALPSILADVKYADLVTDWTGGVDAICRALR